MPKKKFSEILNDTINYFLLGDLELIRDFKNRRGLSNDLASVLTTSEVGDEMVEGGLLIPLSGIVNQPYTIVFNIDEDESEFDKENSSLIFEKSGYILKVENQKVVLFTWWILNDFSNEKVEEHLQNPSARNKAFVELDNGWYDVSILGGFTQQASEYKDLNGNAIQDQSSEPTFEFILTRKAEKGDFTANVNDSFELLEDA